MGATTFTNVASGATAQEAFRATVDTAAWEHGHGGYSGTIAEKSSFTMIATGLTIDDAFALANRLIDDADERIDDKWGPAGCIALADGKRFLFFGWASE